MKKLRIGFIGNFQAPHSTENERKWSLEKLGHIIVPFQENKTTYEQLFHSANDPMFGSLDLYIYSHTHGWEVPRLKSFFEYCKEAKIPTVSVHLDRWAGLARESDIGNEATWFTEWQFMADASPEAVKLYEKHKLHWHYLKPGVVEKDCYMAQPDHAKYPHEIVFVGSKGYHPEYPFRPQMIDFLQKTYGDRFGHYGNDGIASIRGHDLNVLYASAKIAVGDSCFGGRPNYVSDRYYETRGRGGFLIHPLIKGVDGAGVGTYKAGDLDSLKHTIDGYLAADEVREEKRLQGFEWVKERETYTNRSKEMLEVIYGE